MRWLRATFLPASLLVLTAAGLYVPLPGDILSPGRVVPLSTCVQVDDESATDVEGEFLLMTVSVLPASAFDAVIAAFDPDSSLERQIVPPGVDPGQYFRNQREVFALTRNLAVAVGLEGAGLAAEVTEEGARVLQVAAGTPAAGTLQPEDVITEIDGQLVTSAESLRQIVSQSDRGATLSLRIVRGGEGLTQQLAPIERNGAAIIGVIAETVLDVELPFSVDVASGNVGGPSAGLMIALTVYDKVLPGVDLAAGRTIAGTGTLDRDGLIGPVGGVGLKVLAASREGADVFLVPRFNGPEARAALPAGSDMEIVEVTTFEQAREALEQTADEDADGRPPAARCPFQGA